jgi:hypothetical protein
MQLLRMMPAMLQGGTEVREDEENGIVLEYAILCIFLPTVFYLCKEVILQRMLSSGKLCRVALVRPHVSEERIASII